MRISYWALVVLSAAGRLSGAEAPAPPGLAPVRVFAAKELPPTPAGREVWAPTNGDKWGYDIVAHGRGIYAASAPARMLLRFEFDPEAGRVEFREALPFEAKDKESGVVWLHVRRPPGGDALLYLYHKTDGPSNLLLCFAIDAKTGALTPKGAGDLSPFPIKEMGGGYGYPAFVWSPDQTRLYYVGVRKLAWYGFGPDGLPRLEGKDDCRNPGANARRGRGHARFSPDGRQLYVLTEKPTPADGVFWQLDAYDCDPKTGRPTWRAALDVPDLPGDNAELAGFTPDGRRLALLDEGAKRYVALDRDPETGALSIRSSTVPDAKMAGVGGPPWARDGKFAFAPDGRSAYFLGRAGFGWCGIDPAAGGPSAVSGMPGRWARLHLDPVGGTLCLVSGEKIAIWRITPAGK